MKNIQKGDTVIANNLWKHATTHLTEGKEYEVVDVNLNNRYPNRSEFTIISDQGKKRVYRINNTMFSIVSDKKKYTEIQMYNMQVFVRAIEMSVQSFNSHKDFSLYKKATESLIEEYLEKIISNERIILS